jgi:hypothetical protein
MYSLHWILLHNQFKMDEMDGSDRTSFKYEGVDDTITLIYRVSHEFGAIFQDHTEDSL